MNLFYRGLIQKSNDEIKSKAFQDCLELSQKADHQKLRADGYSKLHQDLIDKVRYLSDSLHNAESSLKLTKLENGTLRTALEEAERRIEALKAANSGFSMEVNVGRIYG